MYLLNNFISVHPFVEWKVRKMMIERTQNICINIFFSFQNFSNTNAVQILNFPVYWLRGGLAASACQGGLVTQCASPGGLSGHSQHTMFGLADVTVSGAKYLQLFPINTNQPSLIIKGTLNIFLCKVKSWSLLALVSLEGSRANRPKLQDCWQFEILYLFYFFRL